MALMQLAYISRATFTPYPKESGIEPTVARILATSRRNNPIKNIVGGLYYGDGCFFQYLEGEESAVRTLCECIKQDHRHKDFKVVLEGPIEERTFGDWSMKYVPVTVGIDAFLYRHKLNTFDPYKFTDPMVHEIIDLIQVAQDSDQAGSAKGSARPAQKPVEAKTGVLLGVAGVAVAAALIASVYVLL